MLATLALKKAAGKTIRIEHDPAAQLTEAVRQDRLQIARRAGRLLEAVAASGVAHPSSRIVQRFRTASVTAEAARFPRLARLLHSIADDAQLQIARDAGADPSRMLERMVVAHALSEATARPENAERVDLFGRARTHYVAAGELALSGLGAYGWRTASGFEGLTSLLWDDAGKRFLSVSASRGEGQDRTFSLDQAYDSGVGWSGGSTVQTLCRCQLTLRDAKTNAEGRLSVSEACRVELGAATDPESIDFGDRAVTQWSQLLTLTRDSQPLGLRLPDPRDALVVVKPTQWGQRWFDELAQCFVWDLLDDEGASLQARVPWRQVDEAAVGFLESIKVERDHPTAILGRLEVNAGRIQLYPLTIFSSGTSKGDKILCPQFDQQRIRSRNETLLQRLRKKFKREKVVETRIGESESEELGGTDGDDAANLPPTIRNLLFDVDHVLRAAVESGAQTLNPAAAQTLERSRDQFQSLGVAPMADSLIDVLDNPPTLAAPLLRASYRLQLFRQASRLSQLH